MLKVRRTISISPARCFKTGATRASKIGFISRGGPGSKTTVHLPSVISIPGAVPLLFSRVCAPWMTSAWRALISGIGMLRRANRALSFSRTASFRVIQSQLPFQAARETFPRDVVFGRPEPAGGDDDLGTLHRVADGLFQSRLVVADHGLEFDLDAHRVEPLGQPQRIRIQPERRQHLGTDSYNFSVEHK